MVIRTEKKGLAWLLIIALIFANLFMLDFSTITAYASGDLPNANGASGTEAKPYIINEASDFAWIIANGRYSYSLQTADIDLTGVTWEPIGASNATPFNGTYNGNGYTISNMTLNDGTLSYMGMFGYTSNATIKNITLSNVSFTGGQVADQAAIGAIVGMADGTTLVERCNVVGTSTITGATNDTAGGVVGSNGGTIRFCSSNATIVSGNFDSGSKPFAGGIAGSNWGVISNSYNLGSVSTGTGNAAGGIAGFGYSNTITNCYSIGTISVGAGSQGGAIVGNIADASNMSGNYFLTGAAENGIGLLDTVSGASNLGTTSDTSTNLKIQGIYSGWNFAGNTWAIQPGVNNDYPFLLGVGTVADTTVSAITITTATAGGNATATGYGTITEKGIVYTNAANSTFTTSAAVATGTGAYSVNITGLLPNTIYYAKAYAINGVGVSYGEPILFITNPPAPEMSLSVLQGSIVGTTKVVISDVTTDHFAVNITDTSVGYVEAGDLVPTSGANLIGNYTSGNNISTGVTVGKYLQIYDVNGSGQVVKFNEVQLNSGHIKSSDFTLPINDGFENGGTLSSDWTQQVVVRTGIEVTWSCIDSSSESGDFSSVVASPYAGSYMAKADFYNATDSGDSSRLSMTKDFSLPAGGSAEFSFYMFHSTLTDYGANDAIQPQISLDNGSTWSNLGASLPRVNGTDGWVKHTINLDGYAGQTSVRVGFLGITDYGYSVFIDDVEIKTLTLSAKSLTADTTNNDVDNDIEVTFGADASFEGAITGVTYGGNTLDASQYSVGSGKVTLKPSVAGNTYLRTPGTANVVIQATGYENSSIAQTIQAGAVESLEVTTQPVAGAASGTVFATQPVVKLKDQYGNYCTTGASQGASVIASAKAGTGTWTLGGTTTGTATGGTVTFTDLTCTLITNGTGSITFTSGAKTIDSTSFTIPQNAAKSLTADTTNNDVDNDIEVTFGADASFEGAITGVTYGGNTLDASQYSVGSGKVTLKPSVAGNTYLRTPGTANVVIQATGYENSSIAQTIQAGAVESLEVTTQPVAGAASGTVFATQPVVKLKDQYGNYCTTGASQGASVIASAKAGTGTWTLGGTTTGTATGGTVTFTDLTCTLITNGTGSITFTSGVKTIDSTSFTIPQNAAKSLTADTTNNDVDNDIEVTFGADASFEGAITGVTYGGNTLDASQYSVGSGKVTLKPSVAGNTYLRTPGTANVVIQATGYENSSIAQTIQAGAVESLEVTTQPVAGAASGTVFATQPVVKLKDQYGNYCTTGASQGASVIASAKAGTGTWTLGGTTTGTATGGTVTFTDLTCTLITNGTGSITFTSGAKTIDSTSFTIPQNAAKSLTADTTNNDVDNDIEVTFGADASFEGAITGVTYGGNTLDASQYSVGSGKVTLKPSVAGNTYLRTPGTANVVIQATGYENSSIAQTIQAGAVESLEVTTQPVAGAASGTVFATQPVVKLKDQYGNYCTTGASQGASVIASAKAGTGTWTLGGTTTGTATGGTATFTDLTCTLITNGTGSITFTSGAKTIDSTSFTIPQNVGKSLTADTTNNDVDNDIEVTFGADASFEGAITGVTYGGNTLDASQYSVGSGKVTLKPSVAGNTYLRTPGTANVVIQATGYENSSIAQTIQAGAVESLEVTTQPVAGAASGTVFATQPVVKLKDQYGNYCTTGASQGASVIASAKAGTGTWTLGGTTTGTATGGTVTFTDLTCTLITNGTGSITFTSGAKTIDSTSFTIPQNAAKSLTADTTNNDVDNDIEVTFGADASFEGAITGVTYGGNTLDASQYSVGSGKVTLKPSVAGNTYLRTPGTANVVIQATGYENSSIAQTIQAGAVESLEVTTQPVAGAASGTVFATQPVVKLKDQYGNYCTTGASQGASVIASAKAGTGTWTLGGTTTGTATGGTVTFTDLTCTLITNGTGSITFTSGAKTIDSTSFTILQVSSGGSSHQSSSSASTSANVEVNGEATNAGQTQTTTVEGQSVTTVTVNSDELEKTLTQAGNNPTITIPVSTSSDVAEGVLTGQMVKNMEEKDAILEIKTTTSTYALPAKQIDIEEVSSLLGIQVELKNIDVKIQIAEPTTAEVKIIEDAANAGDFQIIAPAVEFTIECTFEGKTVSVDKFKSFVERKIAIPEGVDPNRITTGIVVNPDGTTYHAPTKVIQENGVYYAVISSLTNSTYTVVWHNVEFQDAESHWAKDAINDMGSRMIVNGISDENFGPNKEITRAEFATILVRALGLKAGIGEKSFDDVKSNSWYFDYVKTAVSYGLINGYNDEKFGPDDKLTREQAMIMIARALSSTTITTDLAESDMVSLLSGYSDFEKVSASAQSSVATCIENGILSGKNGAFIAPKENITRAEVATVIQRMLLKAGLIN